MDASVANWWNEEAYAVDINEEDCLISIVSVDHSITTRAKYENRDASSDINNNNNNNRRTTMLNAGNALDQNQHASFVLQRFACRCCCDFSPFRHLF